MIEAIAMGVLTTAAALVTLTRALGIARVAKYATTIDIVLTLIYFFVFAGTSTLGIMTAVVAGFMTAVATTAIRKGYYAALDRGYIKPPPPIVDTPEAVRARHKAEVTKAMAFAAMDAVFKKHNK